METPAVAVAAALRDRECRVARREADWVFNFGDGHSISVLVPWRVVTADGIAHGDEDDGQWFGLEQPVDGETRSNELLAGQKVVAVEVDASTADLRVIFDGGARLEFFNNSSGYEAWQAGIGGQNGLTVIALGGGGLATH